jgi:DNA (cytosine-5)-methyltransferase 1
MDYTCVDSFSGAGGLSLGLKRAGFDLLLSFDNDPLCIDTQKLNEQYFSHRAVEANASDMLGQSLLDEAGLERGELFLLAGGPPCQGFSVQRIGEDEDKRNNLIYSFIDLVEECLPQYFLMENVAGITGKRGSEILSQALSEAEEAGYWIHKEMLDAQYYGVPQRRKRLFVIGERKVGNLPRFQFPPPTVSNGEQKTVRDAIGDLPPPPEDGTDHPDIPHHRRDNLWEINKKRLRSLEPGQGREHLPEELLAECHKRDSSEIGHRNVYGRMPWDDVAPTITARFDSFTRGQFGHPEQVRSVSLREGAILQTFPNDFDFAGNKVDVASQIGNAVPPHLAEILGKQIIHCHSLKDSEAENSLSKEH